MTLRNPAARKTASGQWPQPIVAMPDEATFRASVDELLREARRGSKHDHAAAAFLWQLGFHPTAVVSRGMAIVEVGTAYIRYVGSVGYGTAHRAVHRVLTCLGEWVADLPWWYVRAEVGAELRYLGPGQRWGMFRAVPVALRKAIQDACLAAGILFAHGDSEDDWVEAELRGLIALCPFHHDTRPSLVLHSSKRYGNCLGCQRGVQVRVTPDGRVFVRLARKHRRAHAATALVDEPVLRMDTLSRGSSAKSMPVLSTAGCLASCPSHGIVSAHGHDVPVERQPVLARPSSKAGGSQPSSARYALVSDLATVPGPRVNFPPLVASLGAELDELGALGFQLAEAERLGLCVGVRRAPSRSSGGVSGRIRREDARARGGAMPEVEHAEFLASYFPDLPPRSLLPDRLASTEGYAVSGWAEEAWGWRPVGYRPRTRRYLLVDVDGVAGGISGVDGLVRLGELGRALAEAEDVVRLADAGVLVRGGVCVVRTSEPTWGAPGGFRAAPGGFQVVFQLREVWHREFEAHPGAVLLRELLERLTMSSARERGVEGGYADENARTRLRMCRLPGPRVAKGGDVQVARAAYVAGWVPPDVRGITCREAA